ncbi:MAG: PIN domain-containing protein [Candidatus Eremiobacteraeota bacterium]|nr:PIN domain-containing protein [Candidatus Eremiobacteraeota bacterium]MCW5868945.1 PIN domain-containing protein [Candidatus Eremiobacteraeota bacterium]
MTSRSFLDTNILVYADDHDAPDKQAIAQRLLEEGRLSGNAVLSTQVLQEYFVTVTRKLGVPAEVARRKVTIYSRYHLCLIQAEDILAAIDLHRLHQYALWDALILRCALQTHCRVLYTEDLQHRSKVEGLLVLNPFAPR